MLEDLRSYEARVYSESGEDGVIQRIFECIGATNRFCVELGALDGFDRSNTAHLRVDCGWRGLLVDARGDGRQVVRAFVTAENANALLARHGVPRSFDLLSIDVDGNDYWIWRALDGYAPRVVVIEYNIFFALDAPRTIPYRPDRVWDETAYHGASLAALRKLGRAKGYALVHTDSWSPNAFFVRRDALPADFVEPPIERVAQWACYDAPPDSAADRPWVSV